MKRVAEFDAIGTHWSIDLPETLDADVVSGVLREVRERIDRFDAVYSRFRADSLVTEIATTAGTYEFPFDALGLFSWYRRLYDATSGAVTPLIGNVLSDAGYDASCSLVEKPMTSPKAWDDVMTWDPKTCTLTVREPVLLDFGAAGKGYCVDLVAGMFRNRGISSYLIDAGGDICHYDARINSSLPDGGVGGSIRIGLENPQDTSQAIGTVALRNQSICGSAGNRRTWGRFHHTINPFTLESPRELAAVWVIAETTMIADGLTTALQFALPDSLVAIAPFEYAVLGPDMKLLTSPGFPGTLFQATR